MAKIENVKNNIVTKSNTTAVAPTTETKTINESKTLTVVVWDEKNQPTANARVSIKPSDASGVTNNAGEIEFKLGDATKYDVTATYGSKTVTVPYYVVKGGATKLVVNPVYVRKIEKQIQMDKFFSWQTASYVGIGLGVIIVLFLIWKFFIVKIIKSRNRKRKEKREE